MRHESAAQSGRPSSESEGGRGEEMRACSVMAARWCWGVDGRIGEGAEGGALALARVQAIKEFSLAKIHGEGLRNLM
jgi:hypothetical protein